MALDNENMGTTMLVQPAGGVNNSGFGWGGDGFWLILLFILLGGWGNGFGGGFGGGMWGMDGLYPWMNNSQNINNGFRDQMINTQINGIQNAITAGFGDVQTALCGGFAGVTASVNGAQNALAQQLYTNQIADLERSYAAQTANTAGLNAVAMNLQNCCCENRANIADLKYTVATENCADRTAAYQNTRDIIDSQTRGTQAVLDKLCALELDGYKRENDQLRSQLQFANMQASQVDQTAQLRTIAATTANQAITELRSCPIPAQPVYGNQPIFTCGGNSVGCGCGCGA